MLVKLDTPILDIEGNPVRDGEEELTVRKCLVGSLLNSPDQHQVDGAEKHKRFVLALRVQNHKDESINLTAEQIVLLKKVAGHSFSPLLVGRLYEVLEPDNKEVA